MNLLQVIHERWAAATALNDLLPASRVHTGVCTSPETPRAAILKTSDKPDAYGTDGSAVDIVGLRIVVYHEHHAEAAAIIHQIKSAFDRKSFTLAGSDQVQMMQRTNDFEEPLDNGHWRMTIDFHCTVYLAAGV